MIIYNGQSLLESNNEQQSFMQQFFNHGGGGGDNVKSLAIQQRTNNGQGVQHTYVKTVGGIVSFEKRNQSNKAVSSNNQILNNSGGGGFFNYVPPTGVIGVAAQV